MALPVALQETVLAQIERQVWSYMQSMHTWFQSNPTANVTTATNYLNALADPYPDDDVKVSDREALFNFIAGKIHPYAGKANAYLSLRQFMLDNPVEFLKRIDPESGRSVSSKAEALYKRMVFGGEGFAVEATNVSRSVTRDPQRGNYIVNERITGTIDGVEYTIERDISVVVSADGKSWDDTEGAWRVV